MKQRAQRHESSSGTAGRAARSADRVASERLTIVCCRWVALQEGIALDCAIRPELLQGYRTRIDELLLRFHGYVVQELPQRLWACFRDLRDGHGGARRAVLAGMELAAMPRRLRARLHSSQQAELALCVGVHTGQIALGDAGTVEDQGSAELDQLIELATGLADGAGPGGVVASEATFHEAQAHFHFRELGASEHGAEQRPTPLYEALDPPANGGGQVRGLPSLTPLCGRQAELDFLARCWQQAARGEAPVAVITGPAGIGKTRLSRSLRDGLVLEPHDVLECACSELLHSTTLYPIIELLEARLQVTHEQPAAYKLERLRSELESDALNLGDAVPLLAALLSVPAGAPAATPMSAPSQRAATLDALTAWIKALAGRRPTLCLIEDLQWADPTTLELVGMLIASGPQPGLMLVLTHRPEFSLPWASTRLWELVLGPLSTRDAARVVASVARTRPLSDAVVREVLEKARGVPLFLEEITKAWLEARVPSGRDPGSPAAPGDSLSRRLQSLGPALDTLQLGAVIGQKFSHELLAAISEQEPPALRRDVDALLGAGVLHPQPGAPQETYVFSHALMHEAAYDSMALHVRRAHHKKVAQTVVERFPALRESQPEFVARQFAAADLPELATLYWAKAGTAARMRCAYGESVRSYSAALEQLRLMPEGDARDRSEVELRTGRGIGLIALQGYASEEVEENYSRALELCEAQADASFAVVYGIWCVFLVRGDLLPAQRLARSYRRMARATDDPMVRFCVNSALGTHARFLGDHAAAQRFLDEAASHYDPAHASEQFARIETVYGYDGYMFPWLYGASTRILRGFPEQGWAMGQRALALAEATNHPYARAMAAGMIANWAADVRGEFALARELASQELSLALEHGFGFWAAMAAVHGGFAETRLSDLARGIAEINAGIEQLQKLSGFGPVLHAKQFLAEAYLQAGDADNALQASDDIVQSAQGRLAGIYMPWALRIKGAALAQLGATERAEVELHAAIEVARGQDARWYELRACTSLALLLRDQGRRDEARSLLSPVYEGFTEGRELPHLREAAALLSSL